MKKISGRTKIYLSILIVFVMILAVGYGSFVFTDTLTINNFLNISSSSWNLFFTNVQNENDNLSTIDILSLDNTKTKLHIEGNLVNPGDVYTFTVDLKNGGKYDTMVENYAIEGLTTEQEGKVKVDFLYFDDMPIVAKDLYEKESSDTFKVNITYDSETALPEGDLFFDIDITLNIVEKDVNAKYRERDLNKNVKVGDYYLVSLDNNEITISNEFTGTEEDQTLVLNDSNIFRVVDIKDDGSIVLLSEYATRSELKLKGEVGYKNSLKLFDDVAKAYCNSLCLSSRNVGYKDQTLTLNALIDEDDTNYLNDDILNNNKIAYRKNKIIADYFISSRYYENDTENELKKYGIRYVNSNGEIINSTLYTNSEENTEISASLRPIIVLKKGLVVRGFGTLEKPYK